MTLPFLLKSGLIDDADDSATRDVVAALLKAAGDRRDEPGEVAGGIGLAVPRGRARH